MVNEEPRVGVFLCHCGKNIERFVDILKVAEYTKGLSGVVCVKDYVFFCSETGQRIIKEAIKENSLNSVVIAACTPKLHEFTFRKIISEANLNPYLLEIVNLREQCAWSHMHEHDEATVKAIGLVSAGVGRAKMLEEIGKIEVDIKPVSLVIGGGIAGIQASLDLAEMGFKVYLVERNPSIGGNMARVVKTFPTGDCAMCILSPRLADVSRNTNIELMTLSEVKEVNGYVGNFKVKVLKRARFVDTKKCTGCGQCAEKCPVKFPNEWNMEIDQKKAIYIQFPQAVPFVYTIDPTHCLYFTKGVCRVCEKICPSNAIDLDQKNEEVELEVGTIIVATGFNEYDPTSKEEYGYGMYKNVITQLRLARMLDPAGPTGGKVVRPSDGEEPKRIVMIQCVGSRDVNSNHYCSRYCCMTAIKHAQMIKTEYNPKIEQYICYSDLRASGKGYEEYYDRARELGIKFIRGIPAEILEEPDTKNLVVRVEDTIIGKTLEVNVGLVVLSCAMVPSKGTEQLAKILGIDIGPDSFLKELHPKLEPVSTKTAGIYICGTAQGPKDIPDSVAQAKAVASAAAGIMVKGKLQLDLLKAFVNSELCTGCGICIKACPYNSIQFIDEEAPLYARLVKVNEITCKGCGSCASECPTGAVQLKHYRHKQILAQLEGMTRLTLMQLEGGKLKSASLSSL